MVPLINLIVATDLFNGISKENSIPWNIKLDQNYFFDVTTRVYQSNKKNVCIVGRNTWESLPMTKLKNRIVIIVSNTMINDNLPPDTYIVNSLTSSIDLCQKLNPGKIFICGGKRIYQESISKLIIDEIYITKINGDYNCDNMFSQDDLDLSVYSHSNKSFETMDLNSGLSIGVNFIKYHRTNYVSNGEESQYLNLLDSILTMGHLRQTRNSRTLSTFGKNLEFDLSKGFPILTTKKVFFRGAFEELIFFLKGSTDTTHLSDRGVKIWEANTSKEFLDSVGLNYEVGEMGPMYGYQLRHFDADYFGPNHNYLGQGIDQIAYCLNLLKTDPYNRRILMTTFNPNQVNQGVLWPCHGISILFNVESNYKLSCMMTQRSVDTVCGLPFNIISYAILIHLFCEVINNDENYLGLKFSPGRLIMNLGDTHIYEDHVDGIARQLLRDPYQFPKLSFNRKVTELTDFKFEDLDLIDYESYPPLNFKMIA